MISLQPERDELNVGVGGWGIRRGFEDHLTYLIVAVTPSLEPVENITKRVDSEFRLVGSLMNCQSDPGQLIILIHCSTSSASPVSGGIKMGSPLAGRHLLLCDQKTATTNPLGGTLLYLVVTLGIIMPGLLVARVIISGR